MEERHSIVQTVEVTHGGDTYSASYFVEQDIIHARIGERILLSPVGGTRPSETVKALLTGICCSARAGWGTRGAGRQPDSDDDAASNFRWSPGVGLVSGKNWRFIMPAKSAAQQKAAGAALSAKRGDTPKSELKGASKSMMSMSESELEKMASTKRKGKPEHKSKSH